MPDLKFLIVRYRSGIFKYLAPKITSWKQLEIDYGSFEVRLNYKTNYWNGIT